VPSAEITRVGAHDGQGSDGVSAFCFPATKPISALIRVTLQSPALQ